MAEEAEWEFVFFRWALRNSIVNSNVELAHLSNVCQKWRNSLKRCILDDTLYTYDSHDATNDSDIQLLLLPSMVKRIRTNIKETKGPKLNLKECNPSIYFPQNETFCAAWFPSEGIREITVGVNTSDDDETTDLDEVSLLRCTSAAPTPFGSGNTNIPNPVFTGELYCGSEDEKRSRNSRSSRKQRTRKQASHVGGNNVQSLNQRQGIPTATVCTEWRGYRSAIDVLSHFGYTKTFVDTVFEEAHCLSSLNIEDSNAIPSDSYAISTDAVRGATVARPERYCLCLDKQCTSDALGRGHSSVILGQDATHSGDSDYSSSDDGDSSSERDAIRVEEYKQSLRRRDRRKKGLQRDVVPRALLLNSEVAVKQRRCVQFLNASGCSAVCMMTPPFACGPIPEPVTIICIGIATEDGCFISGLHHRFEFGHLYPNDEVSKVTEMSSICISTEGWKESAASTVTSHHRDNSHGFISSSNHRRILSSSNQSDYDISSYEGSREEGSSSNRILCDCIFHGSADKANESDNENSRLVHRGVLGPGAWHCYTAVVDGVNSFVRVDGVQEPMTHKKEFASTAGDTSNGKAMLDGLTIGSDHCFGMSLCCGNGSGGEGEGAIAEVAIFSGILKEFDLQTLEERLMMKHGISTISPNCKNSQKSVSNLMREENIWERQAHALLVTDAPLAFASQTKQENLHQSVPLRFLSRHRSVAWELSNPVTGVPIQTTKIGNKNDTGSSTDW